MHNIEFIVKELLKVQSAADFQEAQKLFKQLMRSTENVSQRSLSRHLNNLWKWHEYWLRCYKSFNDISYSVNASDCPLCQYLMPTTHADILFALQWLQKLLKIERKPEDPGDAIKEMDLSKSILRVKLNNSISWVKLNNFIQFLIKSRALNVGKAIRW